MGLTSRDLTWPSCQCAVCVCVCVCVYACMCARVCACVCVRACVCTCVHVYVCTYLHNYVGILCFPPNIFFLTCHLNDVILNYVFFIEIPFIQFGCLLLVCPLLCFFLPFVVVCLSSLTWRRLSVESACLFLSLFVVHWWVQFPSSFPKK